MNNTFGDNLKALRVAAGYSQAQFAAKLDTAQQRVSEWEQNKIEPGLFYLVKILQALECTFEELTYNIDI